MRSTSPENECRSTNLLRISSMRMRIFPYRNSTAFKGVILRCGTAPQRNGGPVRRPIWLSHPPWLRLLNRKTTRYPRFPAERDLFALPSIVTGSETMSSPLHRGAGTTCNTNDHPQRPRTLLPEMSRGIGKFASAAGPSARILSGTTPTRGGRSSGLVPEPATRDSTHETSRGRPFFFTSGRLKELIIRGGANISPLEIDVMLMAYIRVCSLL